MDVLEEFLRGLARVLDYRLMAESFVQILPGLPLTFGLVFLSLAVGIVLATGMALMRLSRRPILSGFAYGYIFVFRGTPLLVQIYLRSEEHTSELQSLMRISYAVFCLKKKKTKQHRYQKAITHTYNKNTSSKPKYD